MAQGLESFMFLIISLTKKSKKKIILKGLGNECCLGFLFENLIFFNGCLLGIYEHMDGL
jgi:hypothetical protein